MPTTSKLDELIEKAKTVEITPEQREQQRQSFAYGNLKIEDDSVTREEIAEAARQIDAEKKAQQDGTVAE